MRKTLLITIALLVAASLLAACGGGGGSSDPAVDAGKALFAQTVIGTQAGCSTCHSLNAGETIVGPSLAGIGSVPMQRTSVTPSWIRMRCWWKVSRRIPCRMCGEPN